MFDVKDKRIVVTGAARGIGDAVARQLVASGASVVSLDRNEPSAQVERHVPVDLADPDSIDSAVSQLDGHWDSLINVAGISGTASADLVMKVNFLGMRHLTEALLDQIVEGGTIVVVSSTAGYFWSRRLKVIKELLATETFEQGAHWCAENPQQGDPYYFSKEAATVYTLSSALRLVDRGIRINAVTPGPVETELLRDFEQTMGKDELDRVRQLVGRHATPADVANAIIYLSSPDSVWVNGHALDVDGGLTGAMLTRMVPVPG